MCHAFTSDLYLVFPTGIGIYFYAVRATDLTKFGSQIFCGCVVLAVDFIFSKYPVEDRELSIIIVSIGLEFGIFFIYVLSTSVMSNIVQSTKKIVKITHNILDGFHACSDSSS